MKNTMPRVVDSGGLLALCVLAKQNAFNRQVNADNILKDIDLEGVHMLHVMLPFHNADHAQIPHHRCQVLMKVNGTKEPEVFMLDVAAEQYEKLTLAQDYLAEVRGPAGIAEYKAGLK